MKKYILLTLIFLSVSTTRAQVACIYCYEQNEAISTGVNNLLFNGSFENGCGSGGYFCTTSVLFSCSLSDWTCTGGTDTYARMVNATYSVVPDGNLATYLGNDTSSVCLNYDTLCLNQINCTVGGVPAGFPISGASHGGTSGVRLEQTVNGLIVGNKYVLEFWAGGENNHLKSGLFAIDVGFGDTLLRNKPTYSTSIGIPDTIGTRYLVIFTAMASSQTIRFTNWGHICGDCTELIIDDASLYTLAELSATVPSCFQGIHDFASPNSVNVFLNNATNELNAETNFNELAEIVLYDITSKKLFQQKFTSSVSLNTEQLAKGIYVYEVRSRNSVWKKGKVVKH
ncbi:MAG: T9SS type A sorting domain-containing protein [Bacteroidia bacterium]